MVKNTSVYRDLTERTDGEIYIGVVGPVRSGKSTFIRKFMEELVLPGIKNEQDRMRASDELPQSAGGRTVMTTEPKFIPDEAATVSFGDGVTARVRLIDCVGYLIPDILGDTEDGKKRLVKTPWSKEPIPFDVAAEMGTRKVITDHSTVGLLVTGDGTVGDIPRENYVEAEERVADELRALSKPFAVILNSSTPDSPESERLAVELEEKYGAPVALLSCQDLDASDIEEIMKLIITEFPVREISVSLPEWTAVLESSHPIRRTLTECIKSIAADITRMGDVADFRRALSSTVGEVLGKCDSIVDTMSMGCGKVAISIKFSPELFYKTITELTGLDIKGEADLLSNLRTLSAVKKEYDRFADAIDEVNEKGYGIVMPDMEDMTLAEPEIVKQAGGYGVRLRATAPSIHMIRACIETELNPTVGTEEQSEELVRSLLSEFEEDPGGLWNTNLFGKSIYELVNDGIHAKLEHMPDDAREKLGETLAKVINEGASGLVCILL